MERQSTIIDKLNLVQINLLRDLFEFRIPVITWDLDEILSDTQTPVKNEFHRKTGFDFRDRRIDQWLALAHWAVATDSHVDFDEISKVEAAVWADEDVLMMALPNTQMQIYSNMAYDKGIKQAVITTRIPELGEITLAWLEKQYSWIDKANVYIRSKKSSEGGISGDTFKGMKAFEIGSQVHFDDSVSSVAEVLRLSKAGSILFPRSLESGKFAGNERVVELPDMNLWLKLFGLHQDYYVI